MRIVVTEIDSRSVIVGLLQELHARVRAALPQQAFLVEACLDQAIDGVLDHNGQAVAAALHHVSERRAKHEALVAVGGRWRRLRARCVGIVHRTLAALVVDKVFTRASMFAAPRTRTANLYKGKKT